MNKPKHYSGVYFIADEKSIPNAVSIAIRPAFYDNRVEWENPGSSGSALHYTKPPANLPETPRPELFIVKEEATGLTYRIELLTLQAYDTHFKSLVAGSPSFLDTEALQNYYLTTNFQGY